MKINRLTEIILILLNKKTVTAKELSDKFQVSTRTIYRDIETLSLSGVPVYMSKGKNGGISLLEDFSINKTLLSKDDKESLMLALKALSTIEYPEISSVIDKMGFMNKTNNNDNWIDIDLSRWGNKTHKDDKFHKIKYAILNNKLIEYTYVNSLANKSRRVIEPIKLIYKGQSWYLYGYCRLKEDFRLFRISRIKNIEMKEESFIKRDFKLVEKNKQEKEVWNTVKVKLKVKKEALYRAFDDFDEESIMENKDGTYEVTMEFPESEWLYGYILSFGPYVEVLEPLRIRNIVLQKMKETLNIYNEKF
ncbi:MULTISPECIES: helix-turn-helix transcriptional regulator [Terrisporobacter]|uniref:YafY family transcriptional regulator n=1 Tax=Terrisporobacter muris TaxID=2963284 RepID=A0A9X2MD39_9FIRM|nr:MULTISPECIES: YafY family protein [Terrisporobacter]MCC3667975.1 YafY family transcriptional regulator [Terrisporobacter mayombei]MCR1823617.1 YafY family transcriptional regulator [Terrisporobacter muris]